MAEHVKDSVIVPAGSSSNLPWVRCGLFAVEGVSLTPEALLAPGLVLVAILRGWLRAGSGKSRAAPAAAGRPGTARV